jgi:hypothetical protein
MVSGIFEPDRSSIGAIEGGGSEKDVVDLVGWFVEIDEEIVEWMVEEMMVDCCCFSMIFASFIIVFGKIEEWTMGEEDEEEDEGDGLEEMGKMILAENEGKYFNGMGYWVKPKVIVADEVRIWLDSVKMAGLTIGLIGLLLGGGNWVVSDIGWGCWNGRWLWPFLLMSILSKSPVSLFTSGPSKMNTIIPK